MPKVIVLSLNPQKKQIDVLFAEDTMTITQIRDI